MKNKSEKVFCYPDTLQNRYLPQAWQIFIMKNYLDPFEKKIDFYTGENHKSFKNMKMNDYTWTENSEDSMNLAFKKDLSDKRKEWLYGYNKNDIIDGKEETIPIEKIVDISPLFEYG